MVWLGIIGGALIGVGMTGLLIAVVVGNVSSTVQRDAFEPPKPVQAPRALTAATFVVMGLGLVLLFVGLATSF
jgi:hypothetical protein